jgi:proline iminopeptidase
MACVFIYIKKNEERLCFFAYSEKEVMVKKFFIFLILGMLILGFGCKGEKQESEVIMTEGFVTVDGGIELRYKTIGNGPETIIIPAAIYMEYEFERLADEGRTLIFYDMRGRGKSSKVTDASRISMVIEISDLEAVRRHFEKEKVSLIGWSYLGGLVALYGCQHPEHVDRVIQVGPISPTYEIFAKSSSTPIDSESEAQLAKMQEEGLAQSDPEKYCNEFWKIYMRRIFYDSAKIELFRSDKCQCENEMPDNVNFQLSTIVASLGEWDWREKVRSLQVPVLTIQGDHDTLPLEGARVWVSSLHNARLLVVREAGHLPFVEQPDVFYPAVETFLRGEWPGNVEVLGAPTK